MSDDQETKQTPVPTDVIRELMTTVSRQEGKLDEGFENIKERLGRLEDKPPHECQHPEEIKAVRETLPEMAKEMATQKAKTDGISKWRWALMSLITLVGGAAVTFAVSSSVADATQEAELGNMRGDVDDNTATLDVIKDELGKIPGNVVKAIDDDEAADAAADAGIPDAQPPAVLLTDKQIKRLRPYEQRVLNRLVKQANGGE